MQTTFKVWNISAVYIRRLHQVSKDKVPLSFITNCNWFLELCRLFKCFGLSSWLLITPTSIVILTVSSYSALCFLNILNSNQPQSVFLPTVLKSSLADDFSLLLVIRIYLYSKEQVKCKDKNKLEQNIRTNLIIQHALLFDWEIRVCNRCLAILNNKKTNLYVKVQKTCYLIQKHAEKNQKCQN